MKTKNLTYPLLFFLLLLSPILLTGQTYVSPVLGYDALSYGRIGPMTWGSRKKFYTSPAYGLKIEQQLADNWRMGLQGHFSRKVLLYEDSDHAANGNNVYLPKYGNRTDNYNISVQVYYYYLNSFRVGLGPSVLRTGNILWKEREADKWREYSYLFPNLRDYGGLIQLGYEYRNFQINFAYHHYLHSNYSFPMTRYARSFQVSLGYLIKVRDRRK